MNRILVITNNLHQIKYIRRISAEIKNKINIHSANSVEATYKIAEAYNIKIFVIDNYMFDGNGIEVAKKLRTIRKYKFSPIIFINGVKKYEMQAFREVHCYDFIIRPCYEKNLKKIIKPILTEYLADEKNEFLYLKYNGIQRRIKFDNICSIESKSRRIHIKTKHEKIIYKIITVKKFKEKLNDDFIQVHQSIIVNKSLIEKISLVDKKIELIGVDGFIPIGETYKKRLSELFERID